MRLVFTCAVAEHHESDSKTILFVFCSSTTSWSSSSSALSTSSSLASSFHRPWPLCCCYSLFHHFSLAFSLIKEFTSTHTHTQTSATNARDGCTEEFPNFLPSLSVIFILSFFWVSTNSFASCVRCANGWRSFAPRLSQFCKNFFSLRFSRKY